MARSVTCVLSTTTVGYRATVMPAGSQSTALASTAPAEYRPACSGRAGDADDHVVELGERDEAETAEGERSALPHA